ncbi:MAG TPA: thioredoxin domain-containing protein [Gaiellaceae bacterium]|nr:thioredoxin domain-containing protein [Gaiellaceae bacterium]
MSRRTRLLLLGAVIAVVVVAAAIAAAVIAGSGDDGDGTAGTGNAVVLPGAEETNALLRGIPQTGTTLGQPDAPVTLVEYVDLQCPFCAQWATDAFPDLVEEYVRPGKVRMELRGLAFIGSDSEKALRAVLAAGEDERTWHVLELLFQNQGTENSGWVTDELLDAVGTSAGLPLGPWRDRFESDAVDSEITAAATAANAANIRSTPSFQLGKTGGTLQRVEVASLDLAGLRPSIDALLAG